MAANTKSRHEEIYTAAASTLEAVGGVLKVDQTPGPERYLMLRRMADTVISQTGCSKEAARKNVAKAMHRARKERWGGTRPGAGYPKGKPRKYGLINSRQRSPGRAASEVGCGPVTAGKLA